MNLREQALKELDAWAEERNGPGESIVCNGLSVSLIKAALAAEPEPPADGDHVADVRKMVEPTDGEVAKLVAKLRTKAITEHANGCDYSAVLLTRAADLLECLAKPGTVGPVPVSARLPGPEDCDEKGQVWSSPAGGTPNLAQVRSSLGDEPVPALCDTQTLLDAFYILVAQTNRLLLKVEKDLVKIADGDDDWRAAEALRNLRPIMKRFQALATAEKERAPIPKPQPHGGRMIKGWQ